MLKTGTNEERAVLEAIALCRLKQNSMAEILNLWSEKIDDNGCLMLNLHPLQKIINKYKLKAELERVAVEMVNLVGIDLRKLKENLHLQKQLQFVCGLGYKKSIYFLEKLKIFDDKELKRRLQLQTENIVGKVVYKNCSAFFKINTPAHQELLQNGKHEKRQDK
jgi:transcription elongation factor SPT6